MFKPILLVIFNTVIWILVFQDHFKGIHTTRFVKKIKTLKQPDLLLPLNGDSEYKVPAKVCMQEKYLRYTLDVVFVHFKGWLIYVETLSFTMVCTTTPLQRLEHIDRLQGAEPLPPLP